MCIWMLILMTWRRKVLMLVLLIFCCCCFVSVVLDLGRFYLWNGRWYFLFFGVAHNTVNMLCFVLLILRIFSSLNSRLGGTISAYKIVPDEIEEIKVQYYCLSTLIFFFLGELQKCYIGKPHYFLLWNAQRVHSLFLLSCLTKSEDRKQEWL